ncbi:tRNA preQ1(34) S-adenosylmethionine ribosyltransferase-isomerase QueA [Corticibacter populi]|uniref:S-adenosylmethionine:tRNA ribosyltransferase-isomerase n=1 Tax=Corticibacter populi TaxID=1550736 RepID=A0A3M6QHJ9_9BURK|nr:tRNA preQ1(34) S-adenosylmethionine ribosyltransferase-isomerase QueA [Corticibacter populi]RMX02590.1 tRNA preQ1(34) S-adenosylmethionine ribosyltransferase-isomerase QueA [Corticibacter populi]RZS32997.1 S-adenosylmethionine:tRNA ribosyltransferase-isomerase [Corticibacter populi]
MPDSAHRSPGEFCLSDFDYTLPPELIAQHPASERSASRLLDGRRLPPQDRHFHELPQLLRAGDLLVFNDTQVVKARIFGEKATGGKLEILIERVLQDGCVAAHMKVSKKPAAGAVLHLAGGLAAGGFDAELLGRWPDADGPLFLLRLHGAAGETPWSLMERFGHLPLPPYIERHQAEGDDADAEEDAERYQTVFARTPGAVAAPTAALHFDEKTLAALQAAGVERASITLHVGAGTFQPVKTEDLSQHRMHSEYYRIPPETVQAVEACRARGGRVVAVGTTSVRTLESWARTGQVQGDTQIFITPGFRFQVVDLLLTNFHLPKSTLMMLVSALAGYAHIRALYQHAVAGRYRFFSYGDCMLLERSDAASFVSNSASTALTSG